MLSDTEFGYGQFRFAWGDHICAIFETYEQQMEIMLPFIATGLRAGQRCVWVSSPDSAQHLRAALGSVGGDLQTLEASGQLLIVSDLDFYLDRGVFEPERTIALMRSLLENARGQGYVATRAAGDVSWLGKARVDAELWEGYESRLGQEVAQWPLVVVCQYNARQVGAEMVVKALQTHPIVILGDTVRQNPFYTAPDAEAAPGKVH